ncbi:Arc family DNA-binding protein [Pseudomonas sp. SbB1]|uniref:Arc domain protein DNA binding domain protein n=1 Tax=Pseudomonas putida (strain GB-1) TaxID=76869 RepID=B0KJR5_PSEPG|nr:MULTISPECIES: Arc family DNA-binding protein [Pseudomonas]ABY99293.1 Arc domain protein DNA binding domain protein [Pseudomonas putida GB-1]MBP0706906.1 Arc family DNA-binding protein [Pseudomonas sp. T34]MCK2186344.1 Arc family DNA-binding protein [Pseudomonas sp. MB04B]MDD2083549.1 Arc family DNA-binding protein [Pseudomonas putida]MDD2093549.1 Arc family DNA-binding protein [Pseudomonas putida]
MSRSDPQFNLRIPEYLRNLVMAAAQENKRSATAEILARLEASFSKTDSVRLNLGLPLVDAREETDQRSRTGVDKQALIESTLSGAGVTREELLDAVSSAIESALSGMGAFPVAPDNAKPKPNTGPKPRKRFPKED